MSRGHRLQGRALRPPRSVLGFWLRGGTARSRAPRVTRTRRPSPASSSSGTFGTERAACHADPHRGKQGKSCEKCHTPVSFRLSTFKHPRFPDFYVGRHAGRPARSATERSRRAAPGVSKGPRSPAGPATSTPTSDRSGARARGAIPRGRLASRWSVSSTPVPVSRSRERTPRCPATVVTGARRGPSRRRPEGRSGSRGSRGPAAPATGTSTAVSSTCAARSATRRRRSARTRRADPEVHGESAGRCLPGHSAVHERTKSPPHAAVGFDKGCGSCHGATDVAWTQGRTTHAVWPLEGVHAAAACVACHASGTYRGRGPVRLLPPRRGPEGAACRRRRRGRPGDLRAVPPGVRPGLERPDRPERPGPSGVRPPVKPPAPATSGGTSRRPRAARCPVPRTAARWRPCGDRGRRGR